MNNECLTDWNSVAFHDNGLECYVRQMISWPSVLSLGCRLYFIQIPLTGSSIPLDYITANDISISNECGLIDIRRLLSHQGINLFFGFRATRYNLNHTRKNIELFSIFLRLIALIKSIL